MLAVTTDDLRWDAVLARDHKSDGSFVYAVDSTKVYCRPSCPSRRPSRSLVRFFAVPELAEVAGYRACKRCRPQLAEADDPQLQLVREACQLIRGSDGDVLGLGELAGITQTSPGTIHRAFTKVLGISPRQFVDACRQEMFKDHLRVGKDVTTALYESGYGSSSRVYEHASDRLGMTPGAYRRRGLGMRITYTLADAPYGRLLVARTDRGICAVYLGEKDDVLEDTLRKEYNAADLIRDDATLRPWLETVLERLEGKGSHQDLPLDVRGTAFQRLVWDALLRIPWGETRTYQQIAISLGRPKAARAVGRACATNPVSIVVPCHRAVRGDGGLGGYRWGLARKRSLLEREQETRSEEMEKG